MIDDRLLDAKLESVEARTETKFAQVLGEMRLISSSINMLDSKVTDLGGKVSSLETKIDSVDGKTAKTKTLVISTIIGAFLGMAAIVVAMLAYTVQIASFLKS